MNLDADEPYGGRGHVVAGLALVDAATEARDVVDP